MSMSHSSFHDDLDRLVDGTLDEASRRRLLERMEAEPDAWRRCALAFLEAQAWGQALGTLAAETIEAGARRDPHVSSDHAATAAPRRASVLRPLALAAALLLAFGLGRWLQPPGAPAPDPVAVRPEAPPAAVVPPTAPDGAPEAATPTLLAESPEARPADPIGDDPLAAIPTDLRRRLASEGYRIEPRGGYRPVKTADGGIVRVPYHDLRVRFVGRQTY